MRRLLWVSAIVLLASAPRALAAPPAVTASASPARGPAPLGVTLQASGDAAGYHWDFGDGSSGDGAAVSHTYAAGSWTATVSATAETGETATAQVGVVATGITTAAPARARYGKRVVVSAVRTTYGPGERSRASASRKPPFAPARETASSRSPA